MSAVMPFSFNAVELCVVIINEKPWTLAKEVCKALQYNKKTADIIKAFCSKENFAHKYQLSEFPAAGNFMDWSKDSRKDDYYLNEEGMYEIVFLSQQPKAKDFRRHCFNVLFPSDKLHAMEIEDLTSRVQALEFTNETHQQTIKAKDATIALLNDDLKNREHDNVALQVQRDEYKDQLQKFQDIITILGSHVLHAKDPGKDNIVMVIEKNNAPEGDEFYEYPYYIARIQRRFINTKKRWFKAQYPDELGNPNGIHAFNRFEEKGFVEHFQCHFRLVDILYDAFYASPNQRDVKFFMILMRS